MTSYQTNLIDCLIASLGCVLLSPVLLILTIASIFVAFPLVPAFFVGFLFVTALIPTFVVRGILGWNLKGNN